jgi:hypothetical protein
VTIVMRTASDLAAKLRNRSWSFRIDPFPHVVAERVFQPRAYAELEEAFLDRLAGSVPEVQFSRNMPGYDASGLSFTPRTSGPLALFVSREWHDLIAGAFGIDVTRHMSGGLHHHHCGSADGTIHNDLNPGWFIDYESNDGIVVSDHAACDYRTGASPELGASPEETVRAVAVLFYLNNPVWECGSGGVTGLYGSGGDNPYRPAAVVPPHNNSLLAFECTPHSHHAFLSNKRQPRNSLVAWLHREKSAVVARWGSESIIYWKR